MEGYAAVERNPLRRVWTRRFCRDRPPCLSWRVGRHHPV